MKLEKFWKGSGHWEEIKAICDQREYDRLGEFGVLIEALDKLAIPWDLGTTSRPIDEDWEFERVFLSIPPNQGEMEVVIFSFHADFTFDQTYIENALPMGYWRDRDDDEYIYWGRGQPGDG